MRYQRQIFIIGKMRSMIATLAIGSILVIWFASTGMAQTGAGEDQGVTVTVKGESWDADSKGLCVLSGSD